MVDPEIVVIPFVFGIPATVMVIRMWFRHQEKMATLRQPTASQPIIEARLERVEQALDAIAVEMERVGEGQRFLTRLLADRPQALPDAADAKRGRVVTPH